MLPKLSVADTPAESERVSATTPAAVASSARGPSNGATRVEVGKLEPRRVVVSFFYLIQFFWGSEDMD